MEKGTALNQVKKKSICLNVKYLSLVQVVMRLLLHSDYMFTLKDEHKISVETFALEQ